MFPGTVATSLILGWRAAKLTNTNSVIWNKLFCYLVDLLFHLFHGRIWGWESGEWVIFYTGFNVLLCENEKKWKWIFVMNDPFVLCQ
jgi:hypothetical protein